MKGLLKKSAKAAGDLVGDIMKDSVSAYSAQAAFFIIISAFPMVMLLLTMLKFLPYFSSGVPMIHIRFLPPDVNAFAQSMLQEIINNSSNMVLSISAITALWSSSTGIYSIMLGLTSAYSIKETRGYVRMRLLAIFYTLSFLAMIVAALGVLVFGKSIYHALIRYLPFAAHNVRIISDGIRWLLGFGVLVLFFVISYIAVPDRKSTVLEELPGALVSAVGWIVFSYLYAFYIEHFGGETYQIRAIPSALPLSRAIKAVKDFLDSIGDEGKGEGDMVKVQDTIAKAWANTSAYQAGDKLKPEEMAALVNQLMLTEEPLKSPYGHPTLLRFTLDELAKKFKR